MFGSLYLRRPQRRSATSGPRGSNQYAQVAVAVGWQVPPSAGHVWHAEQSLEVAHAAAHCVGYAGGPPTGGGGETQVAPAPHATAGPASDAGRQNPEGSGRSLSSAPVSVVLPKVEATWLT